jgi:hypothetical protein
MADPDFKVGISQRKFEYLTNSKGSDKNHDIYPFNQNAREYNEYQRMLRREEELAREEEEAYIRRQDRYARKEAAAARRQREEDKLDKQPREMKGDGKAKGKGKEAVK